MTLRASELALVAREIESALGGRPVQKIVQPDDETILLGFPKRWLQITVSPRAGRLHLLDERPPGTGEAAPAFCMLLRKELTGARLVGIETVPGERACALAFLRAGTTRRLLALLYGAGARLILVDDAGRPLGAIGPGRATAPELPPPREVEAPPPPRFPTDHPSQAIASHYAQSDSEAARLRAETARRRALEKLRRRVAALEGDRARADAAASHRRDADLLLAHLGEIPRGADRVTLPDDFGGGPPIEIRLDPALSAKDNAARLYKEHKRLARGRAQIERRLDDTRREIAALESSPPEAPSRPRSAAPSRRGAPARKPPYRRFRSSSGATILVGRGADKNDDLTFHVARGDDLWLHTRDVPGAHVVVPLSGRALDEQTLLDAATLAVHHSPARDEPAADVTYVARKHVRKPRGAAPGLVSVSGGKTIRVRMEPDRLARLLATRSDD